MNGVFENSPELSTTDVSKNKHRRVCMDNYTSRYMVPFEQVFNAKITECDDPGEGSKQPGRLNNEHGSIGFDM